jgi:hypothetical protein
MKNGKWNILNGSGWSKTSLITAGAILEGGVWKIETKK